MNERLNPELLSRYFSELGRKGAKERTKRLTPERRKEIAIKAAAAATVARQKKAKERAASGSTKVAPKKGKA